MPEMENKPKGKKKVWAGVIIGVLVVVAALAAFALPGTEWYQGYMRWGKRATVQPLRQAAEVANERARLYQKFGQEVASLDEYQVRDVSTVKQRVEGIRNEFRNFDEKSYGYHKMVEFGDKVALAEMYPELTEKVAKVYKDFGKVRQEDMFKVAKVLQFEKVVRPAKVIRNKKEVWTGKLKTEQGITEVSEFEFFSPLADEVSWETRDIVVAVEGEITSAEIIKAEEGIYTVKMMEPVEVSTAERDVSILAAEDTTAERVVSDSYIWDVKEAGDDFTLRALQ